MTSGREELCWETGRRGPAVCCAGHLACPSADGLAAFQRLTYREAKNHNAAVTSQDALSPEVGGSLCFCLQNVRFCVTGVISQARGRIYEPRTLRGSWL